MKLFELNWTLGLTGAAFGVLFASGVALAQAPAPDASATPGRPGQPTVTTVDDWTVRCFPVQTPSPCDMFQELDDTRSHQRVLALSIAYVPSLDRYALQITVPLDISIPKGVVVRAGDYTSPALRYRRCDRNGCYVEMAVDKGMIESLAKASPDSAGSVTIVADNGRSFPLKFMLKGFSGAHDQMVSDARAKAKPIAKTGDAAAPAAPAK
jgi:invasion protein IalB